MNENEQREDDQRRVMADVRACEKLHRCGYHSAKAPDWWLAAAESLQRRGVLRLVRGVWETVTTTAGAGKEQS